MNLLFLLDASFNITIILIGLAFFLLLGLYNFMWKQTSEPLENEELKKKYLEKRFIDEIVNLKKDEFEAYIRADRPYTKKKEWYVWKIVDRGYQVDSFKTQEKYYKLFTIFDYELDEVIKTEAAKKILRSR